MNDIPGYEGIYACDQNGVIYSLERTIYKSNNFTKDITKAWKLPLKIIKSSITRHGYHQVSLRKDSKNKSLLVHRLIAITFLNATNKNEINHIDGNKSNNKLSNLELSTRSHNIRHAYKMGLKSSKGDNHPKFFINQELKDVVKMLLNIGYTQMEVSSIVGISQVAVSKIKLNK